MITYQLESWDTYVGDARGLWQQHWEAVGLGKTQVNVDEGYYTGLWQSGQLQIVGARKAGKLVGYCLVVVRRHQHYRDLLCGFEDSYFVESSKGLSRGLRLRRLLQESLTRLQARGVQRVFFCSKLSADLSGLLSSLGLVPLEVTYSKELGAQNV